MDVRRGSLFLNVGRWRSHLTHFFQIPPTSQFSSTLVERSYQKGKAKVMGTTVEAVVGGIFHQFVGAQVDSQLQVTNILSSFRAVWQRIRSSTHVCFLILTYPPRFAHH